MRTNVIFAFCFATLASGCMSFDWMDGVLPCDVNGDDCPPGMHCAAVDVNNNGICAYAEDDTSHSDAGTGTGPSSDSVSSPTDTGSDTLTETASGSDSGVIGTDTDSAPDTLSITDGSDTPSSDTLSDSATGSVECRENSDCHEGGECGAPYCAVDTDTDTNDASFCSYSADVTLCESFGECTMSQCKENLSGPGYQCFIETNPEGCDVGEVCAWDGDHDCIAGMCGSSTPVGPTRLTNENQGATTLDMAAISPSVTVTPFGFAAVYGRAEVNLSPAPSYTYGKLRFARFDTNAALSASGFRDVALTAGGRYPKLLQLEGPGGLVLVFQYFTNNAHEIAVIKLNDAGEVSAGPVGVSAVDTKASFYPAAALNTAAGELGRVGIVYSDLRDGTTSEVYGIVYDVKTNAVVGSEVRLTINTRDDLFPAIVAVPDGFLVATHEKTADSLSVRVFSKDGVAGEPKIICPIGTATRPIAMAYDGTRVAVAWRAGDGPGAGGVYRFGLLTPQGEPLPGREHSGYLEGVSLAPGLDTSNTKLNYTGSLGLYWDAAEGAFGVCFDAQPGVYNGDPNLTTPYFTYAFASAGIPRALTAWPLHEVDTAHSMGVACAGNGSTNLVLWNDSCDEGEIDSWQGELYSATFSCE